MVKEKVRLCQIILIVCLVQFTQAQITGEYTAIVAENGNSFVILYLVGNGTVNVPLPLDVESPTVRGALYLKASNGVDLSFEGDATVAYQTQLLTFKEGESWGFEAEIPDIPLKATLSLPADARIVVTNPEALIDQDGESTNVIWDSVQDDTVSADYKFGYVIVKETTSITVVEPVDDRKLNPLWIVGVVLVIIAVLFYYTQQRSKIVLSKGKRDVMKTLSGNEYKIVTLLIESRQGLKRSDLERKSGIAKSSLASSLYNLEQKNILNVDKTEDLHFVELTQWFKRL